MTVIEGKQEVWPQIHRPQQRLVYFDLNHWISLAQAATGHRSGRDFRSLLEACRAACSRDTIFPLSSAHYMELSQIKDPGQRRDLAQVMEDLSGFKTLISRWAISRLEVDAAIVHCLPDRQFVTVSLPLVGTGVGFALGMRGGLRVGTSSGEDITGQVRIPGSELDAQLAEAELAIDRVSLAGPTDAQVPMLRDQYGWRPEESRTVAEQRAQQEREQGERLNAEGGRWRRGRLRDVICARELIFEMPDALENIFHAHSLSQADVIGHDCNPQSFVDMMPSALVSVELKTAAHRNAQKTWEPNDIHDIDALSVAIPYCEVVVTEKHAYHVATNRRLDHRFGTMLLRHATDLIQVLDAPTV